MNHTWFMVSATECTASPNIALQGAKGQCMNCQVTGSHVGTFELLEVQGCQKASEVLLPAACQPACCCFAEEDDNVGSDGCTGHNKLSSWTSAQQLRGQGASLPPTVTVLSSR